MAGFFGQMASSIEVIDRHGRREIIDVAGNIANELLKIRRSRWTTTRPLKCPSESRIERAPGNIRSIGDLQHRYILQSARPKGS
jgi:hypothetical protein